MPFFDRYVMVDWSASAKRAIGKDSIWIGTPLPRLATWNALRQEIRDVSNGLLLRSDLHRLFDKGYLTVTPERRLEVSPRLKEHFSNGRSYYPLHGHPIARPKDAKHQADPELLRWHNEHVFRT